MPSPRSKVMKGMGIHWERFLGIQEITTRNNTHLVEMSCESGDDLHVLIWCGQNCLMAFVTTSLDDWAVVGSNSTTGYKTAWCVWPLCHSLQNWNNAWDLQTTWGAVLTWADDFSVIVSHCQSLSVIFSHFQPFSVIVSHCQTLSDIVRHR